MFFAVANPILGVAVQHSRKVATVLVTPDTNYVEKKPSVLVEGVDIIDVSSICRRDHDERQLPVRFEGDWNAFEGIVERDVPAREIRFLGPDSINFCVVEPADLRTIAFAHLWELLTRQLHGEDGPLLTNGNANVVLLKRGGDPPVVAILRWSVVDEIWKCSLVPQKDRKGRTYPPHYQFLG